MYRLLSFPIYKVHSLKVLAYALTSVGATLQVSSGIIALRRKLLGAVPYTIGGLIVLSSLLFATWAHLEPGRFSLDATLDYGHVALITECLAFAAAIIIRLSGLRACGLSGTER